MSRLERVLKACDGNREQAALVAGILRLNRAPLDMSFFGTWAAYYRDEKRREKWRGATKAAPRSPHEHTQGGS